MRFLLPAIANLILLLGAFGIGGLVRPLIPQNFSKIDRLAVIPLAGFGLQGLFLFLVGIVRFSLPVVLLILLPATALGVRCLLQEVRGTAFSSRLSGAPIIPASVIAFVLLVTILGGFAEPVGDITENRSDAVAYHYLGPKVWLREGVIRPVLDECLTSFPATVEVQFAALIMIGGQSAPELFAVIPLVLILLLAVATARRLGLDPASAWWAAAFISAMPAAYRGLYGGMIDVVYAAFVILAARIALDSELPRHYVLVGLFCGFAMGTKYTGLIAVALLAACLFLFASNSSGRFSWRNGKHLAIVCVVAAIVSSPWYIRNWLVLGSPIYPPTPLLAGIFHVNYFPPEAVQKIKKAVLKEGFGMGKDPLSLLLLPFHITFHSANFENGAGGIGLVPLAFIPFCFPALRWDRFSKVLGLFAILTTLAWFYTEQESRFLIHVYVLAAIFGVAGWGYVVRETPRLGRLLGVLTVAISISYGLFMIVSARRDDIHAVISKSYAETRRHSNIPFLKSFEYLNNEPSVRKVLVLDPSVPTYYLAKEYLKPVGRWGEHLFPGIEDPLQALSLPSQRDITHVLDVRFKDGGFQLQDHPEGLALIFEANDQRIYRVASPGR
jgi:Dolichyl-phosphate-mannose-protein mannosyltransferase